MSTTFDHPDRLSVRCDARLKPMLAEVARARRQPPGGVIEQLVEVEFERLRSVGRVAGSVPGLVLSPVADGVLARRDAVRDGTSPAVGVVDAPAAGIDRPGTEDPRVASGPAAGSAAGRRAPERVLL